MTTYDDLYRYPPATVADTYAGALLEVGRSVSDLTRADAVLVHHVVLYVYVAAVSRMATAVGVSGSLAEIKDPIALRVIAEAMQVLQEIEQVTNGGAQTSQAPN